jgi:hypothetical protein
MLVGVMVYATTIECNRYKVKVEEPSPTILSFHGFGCTLVLLILLIVVIVLFSVGMVGGIMLYVFLVLKFTSFVTSHCLGHTKLPLE